MGGGYKQDEITEHLDMTLLGQRISGSKFVHWTVIGRHILRVPAGPDSRSPLSRHPPTPAKHIFWYAAKQDIERVYHL
jgi:hypothetical protein